MKKELSIEEKAKAYDEAIEIARKLNNGEGVPAPHNWTAYEVMFPELKESEDDEIRKELLEHCKNQAKPYIQTGNECPQIQSWIAWLEKQGEKDNISIDFVLGYLGIKPAYKDGNAWCILLGDNIQEGICGFGDTKEEALIAFIKELIEKQGTSAKLSKEEQNRFAKGVLTSCALSFINYLDAHKYEGKMCVSNGECEDIENAFHNAMWDKLHRYYCKYIEKQSEQKPNPYSGTSFEYNGHIWGMCARDGGVEILIDGHLKGRVFTNDSNAKEMFIKALERVEEQNSKGYKLTDCDKNSWWEDFKVYTSCTIEQKSAWSEEDENMLNFIYGLIPYSLNGRMWLKGLKDRVKPKTTWKPSDKQIEALEHFVRSVSESGYASPHDTNTKLVYSLLSDLKKLRG